MIHAVAVALLILMGGTLSKAGSLGKHKKGDPKETSVLMSLLSAEHNSTGVLDDSGDNLKEKHAELVQDLLSNMNLEEECMKRAIRHIEERASIVRQGNGCLRDVLLNAKFAEDVKITENFWGCMAAARERMEKINARRERETFAEQMRLLEEKQNRLVAELMRRANAA